MADARDPLLPLRAAAAARNAAGLRRVLTPRAADPVPPGELSGWPGLDSPGTPDSPSDLDPPGTLDCAGGPDLAGGLDFGGAPDSAGLPDIDGWPADDVAAGSARWPADGTVDLASNDYLGLTRHPAVTAAAAAAAMRWGAGSTGSRLVTGTTELHTRLERALAGYCGAAGALVFSSGYLANLGVVTALAAALRPDPVATVKNPGVLVVSDAANHASLIDGCRLARARVEITPHLDVAAVEAALARRAEPAALVLTESVFSVSGGLAPLADLHRVTRAHGALLVIDEAHALGVVGPGGRGAGFAAGLAGQPDVIRTVTLSKSLGAQGGAVLGDDAVIQTLVDTGRSFIFDTGLAPPCAGAALAALRVLAGDPDRGRRCHQHARRIAGMAAGLGLAASEPAAAVVSVTLGRPEAATAARRICAEHGVRAGCFRPPSVPAGQSCLRLAAHATLTERDLDTVSRALVAVADHVRGRDPAGRRSP